MGVEAAILNRALVAVVVAGAPIAWDWAGDFVATRIRVEVHFTFVVGHLDEVLCEVLQVAVCF